MKLSYVRLRVIVALCLCLALSACYYLRAASGQMRLLAKRVPIATVLSDPATDAELARKLRLVQSARVFAGSELLLPDNDSYTSYVAVEGEYLLWNVFAAPEFSLTPKTWCFPVAGCVAYRGHFKREYAERERRKYLKRGFDVTVRGVHAYSTLGRFDDPVTSTLLDDTDAGIVATLFHELAHQRLYIAGDTAFNESYASAVEEAGLRRWQGPGSTENRNTGSVDYREKYLAELASTRERLQSLYAKTMPETEMRAQKQQLFLELRKRLRNDFPARIAERMLEDAPGNNADFIPIATYNDFVPAFLAIFASCRQEFSCFYAAVDALSTHEQTARDLWLNELNDPRADAASTVAHFYPHLSKSPVQYSP